MISISLVLVYLLKVSVAMAAFYLVFVLFLSRNTFFRLNRMYLLTGILFSFLIPWLTFPGVSETTPMPAILQTVSEEEFAFEDTVDVFQGNAAAPLINPSLVGMIYLAGFTFLLLRYIIAFLRMFSFLRINQVRKLKRAVVVPIDTASSFSFLNILFLSRTQNQRAVIAHERAHLQQHHWLDLFLSGFTCIILWFNPVSWFYFRSIRQQHEYLADDEVLRRGFPTSDYLELILHSLTLNHPGPITHQFNSTSLKNRINMMTRKKSSTLRTLLYLLIVPMFASLLLAFGKKEITPTTSIESLTVLIDPAHGGEDIGASVGSLSEKDLSLTYARLIRLACEKKGIICIMTRDDDRTISLKERLKAATSASPDLFISIHFSNDEKTPAGMNILVSKDNRQYGKSLKLGSLLLADLKSVHTGGDIHHSSALLLKENSAAAVIIDLANLAHPKDRDLVSNPQIQEEIAGKLANALAKFEK